MKKALFLSLGMTGALVLSASAQSLYTTTDDLAQFNSGAATVSSLFYSDSSTVNGIGNSSSPGGTGGLGSLQLTASGGWNGWLSGSDFPGMTLAAFSALAPGSSRPWSAESGWGAGTMVAYSGIISFDIYTGNFTDWNWWGVSFSYNDNWYQNWASTSTSFTGADGNTWTHFEVPYTINAKVGTTYFGMALAQNAGSIAGQTFYIDNFQVQAVPEPSTFALAGIGMAGLLIFRRRK